MKYNADAKRPNFLLPKGEYPGKIVEAEEKTSKAGNPMLVVHLEIYNGEQTKFVKDYIVTGGEHPQDWKLVHLAKSCGMAVDGNVDPATLVDRYIRCKIKIKPAKGQYPEDNAIDDYLPTVAGDSTEMTVAKAAQPFPPFTVGGGAGDQEPPFAPHQNWSWG